MASSMSPSRSTKGASKQRRENINHEILLIRDLLPIQEQVRSRLSQLQVMSLCKAYIGKSNILSTAENFSFEDIHPFDFTQALPGFLLITDLEGRIFFVSDNVTDYLAHSMVDVITQTETIYELIHANDQQIFKAMYEIKEQFSVIGDTPFAFTCRMGMMKHPRRNPTFDRYKKMKISGRITSCDLTKRKYFVALCTPRLNPVMASDPFFVFDTMIFKSVHYMDMRFKSIDHNGQHHFGYTNEEMAFKSWYEMIHPDDIEVAVKKHSELIQLSSNESSCSVSARMQTKSGKMICVQTILKKESNYEGGPQAVIVCWNQVVEMNEMNLEDKEEHRLQMNTINYLEHYCSTQSTDKKSVFGSAETKQLNRSELMEKLKRKMQKPESEKVKVMKMDEKKIKQQFEGDYKNFPAPNDASASNFLSFLNEWDGELSTAVTPPTYSTFVANADHQKLTMSQAEPSLDLQNLIMGSQMFAENAPNIYQSFSCNTGVVTMPTPERQQLWSPSPAANYIIGSPASDDSNNQSLFAKPLETSGQFFKQELHDEKRSSFPELKPHEIDEYFETLRFNSMNSSTDFQDVKDEISTFMLDADESSYLFSDQLFMNQLSAMAY